MGNRARLFASAALRVVVSIIVFAIVVPNALSAPHANSQKSSSCSPSTCTSQDSKLRYTEGKSYVYDFESESITKVVGTTDESRKLKLKGQAVIDAISACDLTLTIQQASIETPDGEAVNKVDGLEGSSIRFAYQNGEIENLCVSENDATWSANIKRALVSNLQNKAISSHESLITEDTVSGRCPIQYTASGDTYVKSCNLNACTHQVGGKTVSHGVAYNVPSDFNTIPGVNSSLTCTQILRNGIVQAVTCEESHQLEAFSRNEAGAKTTIKSSMNLVSNTHGHKDTKAADASKSSSIFYDHGDHQDSHHQKSASSNTQDILNQLCPEVETGAISSKVPGLFLQLRKALKYARAEDLKSIRGQIPKSCQKGSNKLDKLLLDAAAMSASDGGIGLIADIYSSGELPAEVKSYFYMYSSFASRPGPQGLSAMVKLLKSEKNPESGLVLAASGLAHQYCKMTNPACGEQSDYVELVNEIGRLAKKNCDSKSEDKIERAVAAFQALGNLDQLTNEAASSIIQCMDSGSERLQIRALDSFRRHPCQADLKEKAKQIFADKKRSSEVRIKAYLATSACLQMDDVDSMNKVISKEKSNQVTSFVASHIRNQLDSSGPEKQDHKSILHNLELPKSIPEDIRKYSKNFEWSSFNPNTNLGGAVESNVIFSQHSFVPRIASVNSTVHAFGRSYNLLEMGVYLEDFEHILEKYFGPVAGKASKLNEIIKDTRSGFGYLRKTFQRNKRSPQPNPIPDLDDNEVQVYQKAVEIENRYGRNGHGDFYLRVMGTSVVVDSFSQDKWGSSNAMRELVNKVLDGAKDQKVDFTQPILFMDDELSIPTSSGFPIKFSVEGTTILSLQLKGNVDIDQIFKNGGNTDIKVKFVPSASSILKARMSTGAGPLESGIQIEGKILQSSAVDVQVKTQKGHYDVKINLPQEKTQLLDIRTDLYWVEQQAEQLERKSPLGSKISQKNFYSDCYSSTVVGLKFCTDVKIPSQSNKGPYFPIQGPTAVSVSIEKIDSSMEGYHAQIISNREGGEETLSVLLDTPGSKIDRKIEVQGKFRTSPTVKLHFDINSPWRNLKTFYEYQNTDSLKAVDVGIGTDNKEYAVKAQVKMSSSKNGRAVYEPLIQYSGPSGVQKYVEGTVTKSDEAVHVDIKTDGGQCRKLKGTISGNVKVQSQDYGRNYEVNTIELDYPSWGVGKLGLSGNFNQDNQNYALKGVATYGEAGHTLSVDSALTRVSGEKLGLKANVNSAHQPALNFGLTWEGRVDKKTDAIAHTLKFTHGLDDNKLTVTENSLINIRSSRQFEITNELQVLKPSSDVDIYLKADAKKIADASQLYELQVRSGKTHQAQLKVETGADAYFDYNLRAFAEYPGQSYEFVEKAQKVDADSWKYDTKFVSTPGHQYNAITDLKFKNERNDFENSISTTVTSDAFTEPIIFKTGVIQKSKSSSAHLLYESKNTKQVDITTEYKQTGVNRPHAINVKAFVNSYLDASLSENHTSSTSNLFLNAHWIPTDRKIGAQTNLKLQGGETFSLDGELKWDVDKDASKVAKISSVTTLPKSWNIDSKNELSIEGRNTKLNFKGKLARDLFNGEHSFDLTFTDPNDKNVKVYLKNAMESIGRLKKSSKLNAKVELLDGKPYELEWDNRIANVDFEKLLFDIASDMKYTYEGDKQLNVVLQLNSLNPGSKRTFSGHFGVDGSTVQPLSYDYSGEWKSDQIKTNLSAKHGTKASSLELVAKLDRRSPKTIADLSYKVSLPINPKKVEGSLKYTYVFNSWTNFEVTEHGSLTINNRDPTTWNQALRTNDNEIDALVVLVDEGRSIINVSLNARNDKRTSFDLKAQANGHQGEFHTIIEGQFPLNTVRASGYFSPHNSNKNYDIKLNHLNTQGGQSFETNLNINQNGERFALSNKIENFNKRKSLELLFTDGTTPRKVSFLLTETTPRWNLESFIKWGEGGRSVTTKGSLDTAKDNFDAVFSIDSQALKVDKWSARLTKKMKSGRNSIAVDIAGKNEKIISAKMDYSMKSERFGETYDGAINLSAKQARFNGNFRVDNEFLNKKRDGEEGRQVKATIQLAGTGVPLKLVVLAKKSDVEKRASLSFCNKDDEDCKVADILLRQEHHEGQDVDYIFKAVTRSTTNGQNKTVDGILVRASRSHNSEQYEHQLSLIINEEKDSQIGYRMYRKVGKEVGFEVQLPERVVSAVAKADRSPGHDKAEISLWMDKIRKPQDRLKCQVSLDTVPKTADNAQGVETLISFTHPSLSQDLKFKSKLVYGGSENLVDLDAELDIFKKSDPIRLTAKAVKESQGVHYQQQLEIPPLNWKTKTETFVAPKEVMLTYSVSYASRDGEVKKSKFNFNLSEERANFSISTPNAKPFASLATVWNSKEKHGSYSYDVRYEVLLPGMDEKQIIETELSSARLPEAHLKMYTASGRNSGEFYEAFIGFKNDRQFSAGVYENSGHARNVLGDLNVALNSSKLLFVKADWESKNIQNALTEAQQRLDVTGMQVKDLFNSYMDDSSLDSSHLLTTFTKALPNLKPVYETYKNELKQINQELRENADTQAIQDFLIETERLVAKYTVWISDLWNAISDAIENFASRLGDLVNSIPDMWSSIRDKIPDYLQSLKKTLNSAIDAFVHGASRTLKKVKQAFKKITVLNNVNWEFLNNTSNGVGKYLYQAVSYIVDGTSEVIEATKVAGSKIIDNSYLKSALTKSLGRYENLLANIVEEIKQQAENLREYILKAFPQKETQDFVLAVFQYAEKKAQRVPVDDEAKQRDIYQKLITAVRKFGSEVYTVDWDKGLVIAQIPLPKAIDSLTDFKQLLPLDKFPSWNFKTAESFSYGITEFFNFVKADSIINTAYRALFTTESSVPPLPAYALLVGSMYFRTFDGQFYHFEGNCQYLLASDFVDQNFTLAINFDSNGPRIKKYLIIKFDDETVVIKPDFSTEVRHNRQLKHLTIDNSTPDYVTVATKTGSLVVSCSKSNDVCLFGLDGFYHSKAMGLLGTNNNELSDDFSSPNGNVLESSQTQDFVSSWKLDKQCSEDKVIPPRPAVADRNAREQCAFAFQDKYSPLRSCYGLVDPNSFKTVCESLSSEKGYDARKAVCSSSLAYAETCGTSLLRVEVPNFCQN